MKKTRFGLIGAGLWGRGHAEIYSTHHLSTLAAVCDLDEKRAARVAADFGAKKSFGDYRELLADGEIDAVAIVTPDFAHADPIVAAAEAGKHIIVEKPLATTHEDLARIEAAVSAAGVTFMVDFHSRWSPPIVAARNAVDQGQLGPIVSAYMRLNDTVFVPTEMLSWASKSSVLWFLGSHTVDVLRYVLQDEVERVYAVSRSGVLKSRGVDVPDTYQCILEFRSGVVATIENNWIVPNTNPGYNDIKVNVTGATGMINMDLTHNQMIECFLEDRSFHPDCLVGPTVRDRHVGFAYESIRSFVDSLATGAPIHATLDDGIKVSKVILAIMDSATERSPKTVAYD